MKNKKITFTSIVKNEESNIIKCLESIKNFCDYFVVVDTGSTDNTVKVVKDFFKENNLKGKVVEEKWQNFAYNRTFALDTARKDFDAEYILMLDADEVLHYPSDFDVASFKNKLTVDVYDLKTDLDVIYYRPLLINRNLKCFYKSILHEYLEVPDDFVRERANDIWVTSDLSGFRSSQGDDKFKKDAQTLEKALKTEKDPFLISRYTFYLAQSYRDSGNYIEAIKNYRKRTTQGFWDEEIFESYYAMAECYKSLNEKPQIVMTTYLQAFEACPTRAESLYSLSLYCRLKDWFNLSYMYAKMAIQIPYPENGLFVQKWIYDYGIKDELGISAYWTERYKESLDLTNELLDENLFPEDQLKRIKDNKDFAVEKVYGKK